MDSAAKSAASLNANTQALSCSLETESFDLFLTRRHEGWRKRKRLGGRGIVVLLNIIFARGLKTFGI
jgi:hypothetical protein